MSHQIVIITKSNNIKTKNINNTTDILKFKKICRKINKSKDLSKYRHIVDYEDEYSTIKVYGFLKGEKPNKHELIPKKDFEEGIYYGPLLVVRIKNDQLDNITKEEYISYYDKIIDAITLVSEERSTDGSDTEGSLADFIVSDSDFS